MDSCVRTTELSTLRPQRNNDAPDFFPAAQNLIVAARAMGLGTTFTSFHMTIEGVIQEKFALPNDVRPCVMIAVGYPDRKFLPLRRKPIGEVIHWNGW